MMLLLLLTTLAYEEDTSEAYDHSKQFELVKDLVVDQVAQH